MVTSPEFSTKTTRVSPCKPALTPAPGETLKDKASPSGSKKAVERSILNSLSIENSEVGKSHAGGKLVAKAPEGEDISAKPARIASISITETKYHNSFIPVATLQMFKNVTVAENGAQHRTQDN